MTRSGFGTFTRTVIKHIKLIGGIVALLWALELLDTVLLGQRLNQFGIVPRNSDGLLGIVFAPLLHVNFRHLIANTAPLAFCAALLLMRSTREFWLVTAIVWLFSGLGVWLIGQAFSVHIGASGVIFGYFGFLLTRAVFDRNLISLLLALLVAAVYGGVLWGMLPSDQAVSWQGHLSGFLAGMLAARVVAR
jgi:membrane associated rhomboid family serine protease